MSVIHRRIAADDGTGLDIVGNAALRCCHCTVAYLAVPRNAHLPGKDDPATHLGRTCQADLCDLSSIEAMVDTLAARLRDWRALVNSAAIFKPDDVTALDPQTYERAMQVNACAPACLAQVYQRQATSLNGRHVIQITDQKLANPNPDFFSYTMSKHALDATIEMLADGAAHREDRVYGLAPGAILPSHDQRPEEIEVSHRLNLLQRKTGADEVAEACLFLATGYLASGQTLFVDSGQHLLRQSRDVIYLARGEES